MFEDLPQSWRMPDQTMEGHPKLPMLAHFGFQLCNELDWFVGLPIYMYPMGIIKYGILRCNTSGHQTGNTKASGTIEKTYAEDLIIQGIECVQIVKGCTASLSAHCGHNIYF